MFIGCITEGVWGLQKGVPGSVGGVPIICHTVRVNIASASAHSQSLLFKSLAQWLLWDCQRCCTSLVLNVMAKTFGKKHFDSFTMPEPVQSAL